VLWDTYIFGMWKKHEQVARAKAVSNRTCKLLFVYRNKLRFVFSFVQYLIQDSTLSYKTTCSLEFVIVTDS